jgi:hypothetical protein
MAGSGGAYYGNGGRNSYQAATLIILINAYKQWYSFWLLKDSLFIISTVATVWSSAG